MKLFYIFIYLCFIVTAKKQRKRHYDYASTSSEESDEMMPFTDGFLDLRGGVRRYFALEAALLDHGRNMICSPMSVLMPLGKLLLGAKKKAAQELTEAVGLKSSKQLKAAFGQLITNMEYLPGVTLDVASRIYVASDKTINSRYKEQAKQIFRTSIQLIDPYDPKETAEIINDWVADKTKNKITKLISASDISKDTSLILVNAVYFAGKWKNKFDKSYTDDFYSPSGVRRIPMMRRQGHYKYWKSDDLNAELIEIPYEGSQASMIIVLPFSKTGLPSLLRELKLSPKLLNKALERMKTADVLLSIPKFKIESELDLEPLFKKIGLHKIFDTRSSDLSGIIEDEDLFVSSAIHKAVIEVNEKGTEAAAATGMKIVYTSALVNGPHFRANRPFLFYVVFYKEQMFSGVFSGYFSTPSLQSSCVSGGRGGPVVTSAANSCIHMEAAAASMYPPERIRFEANHPFLFYMIICEEQLFAGVYNGIIMGLGSVMPREPKRFEANRPFLFYITMLKEQMFAGVFNG